MLTHSRTTLSTITKTSYDTLESVTIAQVTALATTTESGEIVKRQDNASYVQTIVAPEPIIATATANNPIVSMFASIAQNASIAEQVYSACSCLRLTSSTVTAQPTRQIVWAFTLLVVGMAG